MVSNQLLHLTVPSEAFQDGEDKQHGKVSGDKQHG